MEIDSISYIAYVKCMLHLWNFGWSKDTFNSQFANTNVANFLDIFNLEALGTQNVKVGYLSMFIFAYIRDFNHCFVHCKEIPYDLFYFV